MLAVPGVGPEDALGRGVKVDGRSILADPGGAADDGIGVVFIWEELDSDALTDAHRLVEIGDKEGPSIELDRLSRLDLKRAVLPFVGCNEFEVAFDGKREGTSLFGNSPRS